MHRSTWKNHERRLAAIFGTLRQPLSGSSGRNDETCSDSKHEKLFLECKSRRSSSTYSLFRETRELARKENKIPVLGISELGSHGMLLVIHEDDLDAVIEERVKARGCSLWNFNSTEEFAVRPTSDED